MIYVILFLIRSRREDNRADFFLALLTLWSISHVSGWMLAYAGWYDIRNGYSTFMFYYPFSHWFLLGPLLYFFVKAKTNSDFRMQRKDYIHFLLPGLYILYALICTSVDVLWKQTILGETLPQHSGTRGNMAQRPFGFLSIPLYVLSYISLFYYIFKGNQYFRKYQSYIVSELSIAEEVNFKWLRNILYAFGISVVIWFLFDLAKVFMDTTFETQWWSYFFWGITIFYITISGYKDDTHINNQIAFDPEGFEHKKESNLPDKKRIPIRELIEDRKSYLKANLSLQDFAKELNIPPGYLSKLLNSEFNQNFNEFVNEYRVKEVIEKFKDQKFDHYSILGIALECGFNSKATFNRVFKSKTGMSPSQFKQTQIKSSQ